MLPTAPPRPGPSSGAPFAPVLTMLMYDSPRPRFAAYLVWKLVSRVTMGTPSIWNAGLGAFGNGDQGPVGLGVVLRARLLAVVVSPVEFVYHRTQVLAFAS